MAKSLVSCFFLNHGVESNAVAAKAYRRDVNQYAILKPEWPAKFSQPLVERLVKREATLVFSCIREGARTTAN